MSKFELRLVNGEFGESPEQERAVEDRFAAEEAKQIPTLSDRTGAASENNQPMRQQRELARLSGTAEPKTVSVSVRSIVPLLMEAAENDRTWLQDFADDPVRIDADLYDVLLAYQQLTQNRAA